MTASRHLPTLRAISLQWGPGLKDIFILKTFPFLGKMLIFRAYGSQTLSKRSQSIRNRKSIKFYKQKCPRTPSNSIGEPRYSTLLLVKKCAYFWTYLLAYPKAWKAIPHIIVRSKVTGQTSMNPLISANYFWPWILFTFKLPESFWNCFKAILQTQEMNFKKKSHRKFLIFSWQNFCPKKKFKKNLKHFRGKKIPRRIFI